jgi:hypothetical protein
VCQFYEIEPVRCEDNTESQLLIVSVVCHFFACLVVGLLAGATMSDETGQWKSKRQREDEYFARAHEAYDPHEWSKKLRDQKLTYCEWEDDRSRYGNCTSCHKVGVTDFFCLCQEEARFVRYICKGALLQENKSVSCKEALPQENKSDSRQIVDPVVWAGLHGQLGASAYALRLMQPKHYVPPSYTDRNSARSLKYFLDDDGNALVEDGALIDADLDCLLKRLDEGKARRTDFNFLSAVATAIDLRDLRPALLEWKRWASFG